MLCIGGSSLATKPNQTISFLVLLDQLFNTSFVLRCQAGDWLYNNMNNTIYAYSRWCFSVFDTVTGSSG